MSSSEIKALRKSGHLKEALEMAQVELDAQPDNIWVKRNISWVHYEYLKANAALESSEVFLDHLKHLNDLNLPEEEKMIFDNASYQIGKFIFSIQKMEHPNYSIIDQVFDTVKHFHFTKPSESYSFLYKAFHKGYKNWSRYLEFADWWNFDHFLENDYVKDQLPNGKEVMSLVEQAYIAYSKKILEGHESDENHFQKIIDHEKAISFLSKLDVIIDTHPEYQYPSYFKAKLLLATGDKEQVLKSFLPFAKKKRNEFWVWELIAETFANDDERKFACLCKALSLKTSDDFLIGTRKKLVPILIEKALYIEAKTEIVKIHTTIKRHGWKIPSQLNAWLNEAWFKTTNHNSNNQEFYNQHVALAEELLFMDIPEEIVIVEFVNKDKKILNFIKDRETNGYFKFQGLIHQPKVGDVLLVRLEHKLNKKFYNVLTLKQLSKKYQKKSDAIKQISGSLKISGDNQFGFLDNVFVPPDLIKKYRVSNGDSLTGQAMLSFNKKKNEWGWKIFKISVESD